MKRPIVVVVIACLYLLVGAAGFIAHFPELTAGHRDAVAIELTEFAAAVCGVGLLLRQNWARWLALAWIAMHVVISFSDPLPKLAMHVLMFALIAWGLFSQATGKWLRRAA